MNLKLIFEKRVFWVILGITIIGNILNENQVLSLNKTVSWAADFSSFISFMGILLIVLFPWLLFLLGYSILTMLGIPTKLGLSMAHTILFGFTHIFGVRLQNIWLLILAISVVSFLIFGINIYQSIKAYKSSNQKLSIKK